MIVPEGRMYCALISSDVNPSMAFEVASLIHGFHSRPMRLGSSESFASDLQFMAAPGIPPILPLYNALVIKTYRCSFPGGIGVGVDPDMMGSTLDLPSESVRSYEVVETSQRMLTIMVAFPGTVNKFV
tara:strand:+ start:16875 stop:17258 length:384 start_codon:yes stop_codon:yes gene_type:complete